jgi:hypothetical protein
VCDSIETVQRRRALAEADLVCICFQVSNDDTANQLRMSAIDTRWMPELLAYAPLAERFILGCHGLSVPTKSQLVTCKRLTFGSVFNIALRWRAIVASPPPGYNMAVWRDPNVHYQPLSPAFARLPYEALDVQSEGEVQRVSMDASGQWHLVWANRYRTRDMIDHDRQWVRQQLQSILDDQRRLRQLEMEQDHIILTVAAYQCRPIAHLIRQYVGPSQWRLPIDDIVLPAELVETKKASPLATARLLFRGSSKKLKDTVTNNSSTGTTARSPKLMNRCIIS